MTPDYTPKPIGRLVDEAIAVYRAGFRTLALPAAFILLPSGLFVGLAQAVYLQTVSHAATSLTASSDLPTYLATISGAYSLLAAFAGLRGFVALYYFACVLAATPELLARRPVAPGAFLKGGASRFLMLFVISIVVGLVAGLGLLFLLVPGLMLYVYLSMAEPVAGVEQAPFDRALSRSFTLVSGNFWRTVGFFVAVGVIVYSLDSALTSLTTFEVVWQQITAASSGNPLPSVPWQVAGGLLGAVAQTLTMPLMYVAWLLYYLDLRARREGMDLLVRAASLDSAA